MLLRQVQTSEEQTRNLRKGRVAILVAILISLLRVNSKLDIRLTLVQFFSREEAKNSKIDTLSKYAC